MKKHAYLIIAYNEFEVLKRLIHSLDDERNDIYIHFDAKTKNIPSLQTMRAKLYVLERREKVYWGNFSLIKVFFNLLEKALNNNQSSYSYFHLLSGVDMPVKTQDYIHDFCKANAGKEFIGFSKYPKDELKKKVQIYHVFSNHFRNPSFCIKILHKATCFAQSLLQIHRNSDIALRKGPQWCSITREFADYLYSKKTEIRQRFKHTCCADEIFIPTLCWNSRFKNNVYSFEDEFLGCLRYIKWENNEIKPIEVEDIDDMVKAPYWFARKFTSGQLSLIDEIQKRL